ncbi:MAG: bifunctional precorrin-2 dehydrogenase/sirohydrochlorin ferrochelatase [Anaerolineae bacterium]|nr:bifunctional precorrin-2 dehydrogenase/sirohydrochlorin ferrochelatase [Anaerolineae bacterium]
MTNVTKVDDKYRLTLSLPACYNVLMKIYPIGLNDLNRRRTVVVGGGEIATRKVVGLLEAGAQISVISPSLTPQLEQLAEMGYITAIRRLYQEGDLAGAFLVITADDPTINEAVWQEADRRACLVNSVDDPPHCNFILPAIVRRGDMVITISTGGASPALARRLREWLETLIGPEYSDLVNLLAELRPSMLAQFESSEVRLAMALRLIDSDLLEIIKREGPPAAKQYAEKLLENPNNII